MKPDTVYNVNLCIVQESDIALPMLVGIGAAEMTKMSTGSMGRRPLIAYTRIDETTTVPIS